LALSLEPEIPRSEPVMQELADSESATVLALEPELPHPEPAMQALAVEAVPLLEPQVREYSATPVRTKRAATRSAWTGRTPWRRSTAWTGTRRPGRTALSYLPLSFGSSRSRTYPGWTGRPWRHWKSSGSGRSSRSGSSTSSGGRRGRRLVPFNRPVDRLDWRAMLLRRRTPTLRRRSADRLGWQTSSGVPTRFDHTIRARDLLERTYWVSVSVGNSPLLNG
jgi:hypothetical protein